MKKENSYNLKEIGGKKFRVMWSTKILYSLIYFFMLIALMISFDCLLAGSSIFIDFADLSHLLILVPFILLMIIINNSLLGPIVAVINEKGIYTKTEFIKWKKINAICYRNNIPLSKNRDKYEIFSYLEIYTDANRNKHRVLHAPHKMVRCIKKYIPDVKVKRDKEFMLITLLYICIFTAIPLLHKF